MERTRKERIPFDLKNLKKTARGQIKSVILIYLPFLLIPMLLADTGTAIRYFMGQDGNAPQAAITAANCITYLAIIIAMLEPYFLVMIAMAVQQKAPVTFRKLASMCSLSGYMHFFLKYAAAEIVVSLPLLVSLLLSKALDIAMAAEALPVLTCEILFVIEMAAGISASVVLNMQYTAVPFIALEHPEAKLKETLAESKQRMKGYKLDMFLLEFSFIDWMLFGLLALGIPLLYAVPYMILSQAIAYENVLKRRKL